MYAGRVVERGEIAARLDIKEQTVKIHLHSLFRKLNVRTRVEAALQAARARLGERAERVHWICADVTGRWPSSHSSTMNGHSAPFAGAVITGVDGDEEAALKEEIRAGAARAPRYA